MQKEYKMSTKIFVRERRKVEKGEKKPRFRVVGVSGGGLKLYVKHIRKKELDQIKDATGAEIIMLEAGQGNKDGGGQSA
jgi:c-di-GMP-binding flagellar brake protein YcgR